MRRKRPQRRPCHEKSVKSANKLVDVAVRNLQTPYACHLQPHGAEPELKAVPVAPERPKNSQTNGNI